MPFNVKAPAVQVPLQVFSGLVTEMAPDALPEGVSPDCQELEFVPGSAFSRAGFQRVFDTPFPGNGTITYGKSYVTPSGDILNLYFDSNGILWQEDFTNAPGIYIELLQSTPGTYAKSITAFGREYIAISDGLHGQEVPLQYDGTFLDRVTQDGPGSPPVVVSSGLPSVAMGVTGVPAVLTVVECDPANQAGPGGSYTAINIYVTALGSANVGQNITIAANSSAAMNGTYAITAVYGGSPNSLIIASAFFPAGTAFGLGGTGTLGHGTSLQRSNNIVTAKTAAAHQLQPGYQAQISNMTAAVVGGAISSIVINNESSPGLATVTMTAPSGLVPNTFVTMTGIAGTAVGGATSFSLVGDVGTAQCTTPHNLAPGAVVTLGGATAFDATVTVVSIASPTAFTFILVGSNTTASGGTVTLNWPITATSTPNYYQVVAAPTANSFQIQIDYPDGAWNSGTVSYAWDGTFFVLTVPDSTTFTYQQYGPNSITSQIGTVTPYGQAAPGIHQCQVAFLTRQGAITEPSPPVTFVANGGQYISVSNIPTGPANIVGRILLFTGAQGAYFFYIPVPAQVNGQQVSTATQINDNTTTSILLDFSDNTLFASIGTSIPGNNLANQIVLDSALGFGYYASRLVTYGQRNRIQNLLNMGFDGGALPSSPDWPTGWTNYSRAGSLTDGHFGQAWRIQTAGSEAPQALLYQSFYEDAYGAPIGQPNTQYKLRVWLKTNSQAADVTFYCVITSPSTGFQSIVTIAGPQMTAIGNWVEASFSQKTPAVIPPDMQLQVYAQSATTVADIIIDELSVIYSQTPYLTGLYGSYVNNEEGFDGVTGYFGPQQDTRTVMDIGIIRNSLYLLTRDPSGRLHQTNDNGVTEPSGWTVNQVAANCGALSAFSLSKSQADDETGSGGEEWFSWASSTGLRIFGGDQPWKISQEIQPNWSGDTTRGFAGINFAAALTIWSINDTVERVVYTGIPSLDVAGTPTAPNLILPMNYRELDSAYAIAQSPPIRASYTGRLIATDNTRKWTRWNRSFNGAAQMYRGATLSTVFFAGNGQFPGTSNTGFGNIYVRNPLYLTDDDYGQIFPWYVTYGFVSRDQEQALQLGSVRKILTYATAFIKGVGTLQVSYLANTITNVWPLGSIRQLQTNPTRDMEFAGGSVQSQRIFIKFASFPVAGQIGSPDNSFAISKCMAALRPVSRLPVAGAA